MKLREELGKFGPKIVRQDDKVGTLWLERGVGMRMKTLEKFDVDGFVCVVNPLGEPEFVLKVVVLSDYLPLKIYKVEWAIETRGESLPDSFVEDDFADGIIVRYPSSVLSGEMNNGEIEIGCGMILLYKGDW